MYYFIVDVADIEPIDESKSLREVLIDVSDSHVYLICTIFTFTEVIE